MRPPAIPHRLRTRLLLLPAMPLLLWAVVVVMSVVQSKEVETTFEQYAQQNIQVYQHLQAMYAELTEQHLQIGNMLQLSDIYRVDSEARVVDYYQSQAELVERVSENLKHLHQKLGASNDLVLQHQALQTVLSNYRDQLLQVLTNNDPRAKAPTIQKANQLFILISQQFAAFMQQIEVKSFHGFEQLKQTTAEHNRTLAIVATLTVVLVLIGCVALYRRLSGGFQQMLQLARAMQGRGLKRQHYEFSDDEMGYLAKRIYLMGMALDDMRQNLETRVDQRTEELQKVTQHLVNEVEKSQAMASQLRYLAETDELTGLYNRRYFVNTFEREWQLSLRHGRSLVLLLIDVDLFKQVNDRYGHQVGDQCLRVIATTLKLNARRSSDLVARFGGEEFAIMLPETELAEASDIAQNILESINQLNLYPVTEERQLSVSIGLGFSNQQLATSEELFSAVDEALYAAKEGGRNCYKLANPEKTPPHKQRPLF